MHPQERIKIVKIRWLAPILLTSIALGACEEKPYKPPTPHTDPKPQSALMHDQTQALEKAKGVEQLVRRQDQEARRDVDRASR